MLELFEPEIVWLDLYSTSLSRRNVPSALRYRMTVLSARLDATEYWKGRQREALRRSRFLVGVRVYRAAHVRPELMDGLNRFPAPDGRAFLAPREQVFGTARRSLGRSYLRVRGDRIT